MPLRRKVMVWLYRTEPELQVLLLKRKKKDKGEWHPVTGNVEAHEPIPNAALREVEEETGVELAALGPLGITFTFEDPKRNARYHETAFAGKVKSPDVKLSDEHEAHEWLAPAVAMERLHWPDQKKALETLVKRQA
jgi:ADP-ribose pyrophosphatase YjhB (NUDIX family)